MSHKMTPKQEGRMLLSLEVACVEINELNRILRSHANGTAKPLEDGAEIDFSFVESRIDELMNAITNLDIELS